MSNKLNSAASAPIVPLKDLNLSARFLFDEVMEDPQTQQDVLSIIFGREIPLVKYSATEKELRLTPLARSIRMDLFSVDEDAVVYDTEMQDKKKSDLEKRSRYYQALMDTSLLEPGITDYNSLNQTYLIMIMTFDLFGYGKYRYTFVPMCREVRDCELEDGAVRIFLSTKGTNEDEVPKELVDFLHYVENTTDAEAARTGSERIHRIHERVRRVRSSEEVGVRYLRALEEKNEEREAGREEGRQEGRKEGLQAGREEGREEGRQEGRQEGHQEINQLIARLIADGRTEELLKSTQDREYQKKLMKEYQIGIQSE